MNKFLLALVSLGVMQGVLAKDPDAPSGRYQFNNFSYKLDPYVDQEPRPLNDDKAADDGLSAFLPPNILNTAFPNEKSF